MGLLGDLGVALQGGGQIIQGNVQAGNKLLQGLDHKLKVDKFKKAVAQLGGNPDDPLTWNEDVLALGAKTGALTPQEVMNLGISLAKRRAEQQRQQMIQQKFDWQKQDRATQQQRLDELRRILASGKQGKELAQDLRQGGFLEQAQKVEKDYQQGVLNNARLSEIELRKRSLKRSQAEKENAKRLREEQEKIKAREAAELSQCNGDPECERKILLKYQDIKQALKIRKNTKKNEGDIEKQAKVKLGWGLDPTESSSLPEFIIKKAQNAKPYEVNDIIDIWKKLGYKVGMVDGDPNKKVLVTPNGGIPIKVNNALESNF